MNSFLRILIIGGLTVGTAVVGAAGYTGYLYFSHYRIGDKALSVTKSSSARSGAIDPGEQLVAMTFNIDHGIFSQEYTSFFSKGYSLSNVARSGRWAKGRTQKDVEANLSGAVSVIQKESPNFLFLQGVDYDASRSYHIDEEEYFRKILFSFDSVNAVSQHSPYLPYPVHDMVGYTGSCLSTFSKYAINNAMRHELPMADSLTKYFDMDPCFQTCEVNVSNGRKLYLVNVHLGAFGGDEKAREKQLKALLSFFNSATRENAYVVAGGDWNQDLLTYNPAYGYSDTQKPFEGPSKEPDNFVRFFGKDRSSLLGEAYQVVASDNAPSWRNADSTWEARRSFAATTDGFIVSNNVNVVSHKNVATTINGVSGFAYSDHDPALMTFSLKA